MPMSATGRFKPFPFLERGVSGFTLIEILVAMLIVGILATSVVLTLPDTGLSQRRASVRGWKTMAETAALRAEARAQPYAWEISETQARLLILERNRWQVPEQAEASTLALAEGLAVDHLENDGQRLPLGSRIVFSGTPPLFVIRIGGHGRSWQLDGQPNGAIAMAESLANSPANSP